MNLLSRRINEKYYIETGEVFAISLVTDIDDPDIPDLLIKYDKERKEWLVQLAVEGDLQIAHFPLGEELRFTREWLKSKENG